MWSTPLLRERDRTRRESHSSLIKRDLATAPSPITTNLRAVASPHAVLEALPQPSSSEATDYEVEIGGDQISYAEGGPVIVGSQVVGKYTNLKPSFLPQV
jgi:hypothetical protein